MWGIFWSLVGLGLIAGAIWFRRKTRKEIEELHERLAAEKAAVSSAASAAYGELQAAKKKAQQTQQTLTTGIWIRRAAVLGIVVGFLIFAATVVIQVPTRSVAVTDAFGKPVRTLSNGLGLVAPWESPTIYDASVQTLVMSGDGGDGKPAQKVRIMNGTAAATMEATVEWRIDPKIDITELHKDRRSFTNIETKVVIARLAASLNAVFESYDPLIALKDAEGKPVKLSEMEIKVKDHLQASMPAGVLIRTVMLPFVQYPPEVQKALDKMAEELANTQIAIQQKLTAEQQKIAIETLASAKMTPEAFLQYCLVVTERLAQQGKRISEAWNCVGGTMPITVMAGK